VTLDRANYLCDPRYVRRQYESEDGPAARASLYAETTGPFAGDVAFDAVAEASPRRVLEVGCGTVRGAPGTVTIRSREAVVGYVGSTEAWKHLADRVPANFPLPFVARRSNVVFLADT
jgi:hypothetical protein